MSRGDGYAPRTTALTIFVSIDRKSLRFQLLGNGKSLCSAGRVDDDVLFVRTAETLGT